MPRRATTGMYMPPTGIISPKNSLPIFDQSKGRFPCFGIQEDVNKERGTQMDTQFQDGFFQQERLNPNDHGRLRTGVNNVSVRLPATSTEPITHLLQSPLSAEQPFPLQIVLLYLIAVLV